VLITDRINIWREIQAEQAGLIDTDDAEGVTRLLAGWHAMSAQQIEAMRQTARQCFLRNFDIAKVSGQFFDLVQASIRERSGVACAS
jgi:hypothetical protein